MARLDLGAPAFLVERARSTMVGAFGAEYWAVTTRRTNVLIQGSDVFVADMLAAVRRDLPQPEFVWPDVPAAIDARAATVLVPDVGALSAESRDALTDVIARSHSRIQVVATSSILRYELVAAGEFPADLYYRLNIIMLTDGQPALDGADAGS
jgi:hypothetical protein